MGSVVMIRKRITLFFWLALAAIQLLFSASVAPANPLPGLENRAWKILTSAAQTRQPTGAQVTEAKRERPPPSSKTALDVLLAPESETAVSQNVFAYNPGSRGFVIQQGGPLISASRSNPDPFSTALSSPGGISVTGNASTLALPASSGYNPWDGEVSSVVAQNDTIMYRVWGGGSSQVAGWLSPTPPASTLSAIRDLALPPANSAEFMSEVFVPAGTRYQIGPAAGAFGQPGGATQVLLLDRIPVANFGDGQPLAPWLPGH
jgi:hypothetical protein